MGLSNKFVLMLALLVTLGAFSCLLSGPCVVSGEGSTQQDDDSRVDTEDEVYEEGQAEPGTGAPVGGGNADDLTPLETTAEEVQLLPAEDAETSYIFTEHNEDELPAGKVVEMLVSLRNNGDQKRLYNVNTIFGSLRYPMDFTYYLQNFTRLPVNNRSVDVNREATFSYLLRTSDYFSGRPFGLVVEIAYHDDQDQAYVSTVFNKTLTFVEVDETFDAEAIMLYLLFGAVAVLVVVLFYYAVSGKSLGKKGVRRSGSAKYETGKMELNGGFNDEWLPNHARKSPKVHKSPKKSKKDN